jgi:protein-tyrosine-phosphatase/DNA-binding HxlR family transcriptional regulator
MDVEERARIHAALGDRNRLTIIDQLVHADRAVQELVDATGLPGNLMAHHLDVLGAAGLIERHASEGDHRRRYVTLRTERLEGLLPLGSVAVGPVLFVCTHNSARSQFAAALWRARTGDDAESAGTHPAARIHPLALDAASEWAVDLGGAVPKGYDSVAWTPALVVSVCDRARESGIPFPAPALHWSIPDPVTAGDKADFRRAFGAIASRIDRLAAARSGSSERLEG